MKSVIDVFTLQKFLLYVYLAMVILFQSYSNILVFLTTLCILVVNVFILIMKHKISFSLVKIVVGCLFLICWILMSIFLGQSKGVASHLYKNIEFFLCLINYLLVITYFKYNDLKKLYLAVYILTVVSLIYNIFIFLQHPEYRNNLYITNQNDFFIGGVSFSMYIGFFSAIQLYDYLNNHTKFVFFQNIISVFVLVLSGFYLTICSPSATVLIVTSILNMVLVVNTWKKYIKRNSYLIGLILCILISPLLIWFLLNGIVGFLDPSSRLYNRFISLIDVIQYPGSLLTNEYLARVSFLFNEIELTFSSISNMMFGTGYNFLSYSSVSEQMQSLGIGYHSSMIDWFPTFGIIYGILLWLILYTVRCYINDINSSSLLKYIWVAYVCYCFLNVGFNTLLITVVVLFAVIYQLLVSQAKF